VTDGRVGDLLSTTQIADNESLFSDFGTHTYQLQITYTSTTGQRNQVLMSQPQMVTILAGPIATATANLTLGQLLTADSASFNYAIDPANDQITNQVITIFNNTTGLVVDTLSLSNNLSGTANANGTLLPETEYRAELIADLNGVSTSMTMLNFKTLPTNLNDSQI